MKRIVLLFALLCTAASAEATQSLADFMNAVGPSASGTVKDASSQTPYTVLFNFGLSGDLQSYACETLDNGSGWSVDFQDPLTLSNTQPSFDGSTYYLSWDSWSFDSDYSLQVHRQDKDGSIWNQGQL